MMKELFEVPGLNIYLQIIVTLSAIFMWGAGVTHMIHKIQHNNISPGNTGIVVYWDFLLPLILMGIYGLYRRERASSPLVE